MRSCLKPMEITLLLVLVLGLVNGQSQARRLETTSTVSPIDGQISSTKMNQPAHKTLHFEMLPKEEIIPPFGLFRRIFSPPSFRMPQGHKILHFEMLPKGDIIPPSGSSTFSNISPPPPHFRMPQGHKTLHFEILPTGDIITPSGPSSWRFRLPPPPHRQIAQGDQLTHKTLHFEMLPKGDQIPPDGPSTYSSISPPPPPHHWM